MADEEQKLCDNCHERPGTNHICHGHGGEGRSLCQVCLLQDAQVGGLLQRFSEAVRVGHCKHCGAPAETAFGGSTSVFGDHFNLVCRTCFDDLSEFVRRPENATFLFGPADEASARNLVTDLADFEKRKDEFMRRRVSERKAK